MFRRSSPRSRPQSIPAYLHTTPHLHPIIHLSSSTHQNLSPAKSNQTSHSIPSLSINEMNLSWRQPSPTFDSSTTNTKSHSHSICWRLVKRSSSIPSSSAFWVSLDMACFWCYHSLYSGQQDTCFGTALARRNMQSDKCFVWTRRALHGMPYILLWSNRWALCTLGEDNMLTANRSFYLMLVWWVYNIYGVLGDSGWRAASIASSN